MRLEGVDLTIASGEYVLSDAPSEPSDEEILLKTMRSQWDDLHHFTRHNPLKFETPGFELPLKLRLGSRM